jgi:uncharacterized membrane protein (DUF373 family)
MVDEVAFDTRLWNRARQDLADLNDELPADPTTLQVSTRCQYARILYKKGWFFHNTERALGLTRRGKSSRVLEKLSASIPSLLQPLEGLALGIVMALFVFLAGRVLWNAIHQSYSGRAPFSQIPLIISDGLLIVILMEITETIRQQMLANERLSLQLVRNFLVIGVVSAIRHVLAVGAELSFLATSGSGSANAGFHQSLLWELAINGAVVAVLLIGFKWVRFSDETRNRVRNTGSQWSRAPVEPVIRLGQEPSHIP